MTMDDIPEGDWLCPKHTHTHTHTHTNIYIYLHDMFIKSVFDDLTHSKWLHNAQHMVTILSVVETLSLVLHMIMLTGNVDCSIVYFCCTIPITRSTCILICDN